MINSLVLGLVLGGLSTTDEVSPKMRILLVGAGEYPEYVGADLSGDKDVERLHDFFLTRFKVPQAAIKVLNKPNELTRTEILRAIDEWLIAGAKPGESIIFWWGGHGVEVPIKGTDSTIGAIVPPSVLQNDLKELDSSELILTRELRYRFSSVGAKATDVTWFLDSCYSGSADRAEGVSRAITAKVSPAIEERLNLSEDGDPENWVYVSAGGKSELVKEVSIGAGVSMGPLAYSLLQLGPRLQKGMTYRDLESSLDGISLKLRSNRNPEVRGSVDRQLFSGQFQDSRWAWPVFFPQITRSNHSDMLSINLESYFKALKSVPTRIKYDPLLPFIPAGQLSGLKPGMRVEVQGTSGYRGTFEITICLADFAQLKPVGNSSIPQPDDLLEAQVVDSLGAPTLKFCLADANSEQKLGWPILATEVSKNPYIEILSNGDPSADFSVDYVQSNHSAIFRSRGGSTFSVPIPSSGRLNATTLNNIVRAELVRDLQVVGLPAFEVEHKLVHVNTNISPQDIASQSASSSAMVATQLEPTRTMSEKIGTNETFSIAVRVRVNPNLIEENPDVIREKYFRKSVKVFLNVIGVTQDSKVFLSFPKGTANLNKSVVEKNKSIELNYDQWTEWMYLGQRGTLIPESSVKNQLDRLKVLYPDPIVGEVPTECFKIFITEENFDFEQLVTPGVRSGATSAPAQLINSFWNDELLQSRGEKVEIQNWGLATILYRVADPKTNQSN